MFMQQATIEKVMQRQGYSWRYRKIEERYKHDEWHFHQEYELVIHRHFRGKGFIGHYEGEFGNYTMVLIGPGLPHRFVEVQTTASPLCETHVIWFRKEWIANMMFSCVEMRKLESLLKRAEKGIEFSENTCRQVLALLEALPSHSSIAQLGILLQVLSALGGDKSSRTLLSYAPQKEYNAEKASQEKIEKVCQYLEEHFSQAVTLSELAAHMNTSESSIHRLFAVHFKESFSQYLKKLRLNHAAELLQTTSKPIGLIAESVGYRNQVNFNRQFKDYKQMTPRQYRNSYKINAAV
ncbi:AraC family transcriptional regulator (plasmid) [Photobacterium sp. DA100]|uniref:AraC family transcriptional regulator n=1 Tax=Photobacterium sp. DA100 TaxID=3027472 RepID=UPI002478E20C|nr:AraC family transcriptional regulator [Photobacterium sp. DA100]WEM45437.1 AraC family transcriptional regulator [Photobacterium sp. DA100]